jgi:hypothetical protein
MGRHIPSDILQEGTETAGRGGTTQADAIEIGDIECGERSFSFTEDRQVR